MALDIVIMAAGKGTRMKSALPKVLHRLAGRSLLQHVLDTAAGLGAAASSSITGHGADAVEAAIGGTAVVPSCARSRSSAPATRCSRPCRCWTTRARTLILNGDVPLIEAATARALVAASGGSRLALLTVELADPSGYGRIVRGDPAGRGARGRPRHGIVEHKDATPAQRAIREVYTGVMAAPTRRAEALARGACATTTRSASTT